MPYFDIDTKSDCQMTTTKHIFSSRRHQTAQNQYKALRIQVGITRQIGHFFVFKPPQLLQILKQTFNPYWQC